MAVSDDTKGLAPDLPTALGLFVPNTLVHFIATLEVLAGESHNLGNNELRDGTRIGEWGVEDWNASLGRC